MYATVRTCLYPVSRDKSAATRSGNLPWDNACFSASVPRRATRASLLFSVSLMFLVSCILLSRCPPGLAPESLLPGDPGCFNSQHVVHHVMDRVFLSGPGAFEPHADLVSVEANFDRTSMVLVG